RETNRSIEDGGIELAAGERDQYSACTRLPMDEPSSIGLVDKRSREHEDEPAKDGDRGSHFSSSSRSVRSAITRMSIPGSSRTMRDKSEPPRISRRRDSSGVPTNT